MEPVYRLYHVIGINDKTGVETQLTGYPMPHKKCMTFISKHPPRAEIRYMVREVSTKPE